MTAETDRRHTPALPLAPLSDEGLSDERKDAWADLAAWAKTGARNGFDDYVQNEIRKANARHDYAAHAGRIRRESPSTPPASPSEGDICG